MVCQLVVGNVQFFEARSCQRPGQVPGETGLLAHVWAEVVMADRQTNERAIELQGFADVFQAEETYLGSAQIKEHQSL